MPDRMLVRFSGDNGSGSLMWGQIAIWDVIAWLPATEHHTLNLIRHVTVPDGTTLGEVATALGGLITRHESLRSTFHDTADEPAQVVAGNGELQAEIVQAGADDEDRCAREVAGRLLADAFDSARDLPVRLAVLATGDVPRRIMLVFNHMAVDGWSLQIVVDDLRRLLADPTGAGLEPVAQQPLARAAYERGPTGQQRERRALAFWERHLTTLPTPMLSPLPSDDALRLEWAEIDSPALALAAADVAARTGLSQSQVTLAAAGLLLALYTGEETAGIRVIVATRFQLETRRLVGAFNQNALFRVELADEPVLGFFQRSATAAMAANRHCEYHPRLLESMVDRIGTQRGIEVGGYCFFNDIRYDAGAATETEPQPDPDLAERLAEALPRTRARRLDDSRVQKGSKFFLYLKELGDRAVLQLCAHPAFLAPRGTVDFLRDLEHVLLRAVSGDGATVAELRAEFQPARPAQPVGGPR